MDKKISGQNRPQSLINLIRLASILVVMFVSSVAAAEVKTNQELKHYISVSTLQLMNKLNDNKEAYQNDKALFYRDLNSELNKIIDFKRIALKIMGKHSRQASKEQRAQFVQIFKQSLYKTYAHVLLENQQVDISVVNAAMNPRNSKKAKVNIVVKAASGSNFNVSYSLHKGKDLTYRVENIVVMGINLGLAYKDRFQQQVKLHKGDINAVIEHWSFDEAV